MKPATKILGLTAACVACCAGPALLMPVLAGIGLAGAGTAIVGWGAGLTVLAMTALGVIVFRHRRAAATASVDQGCGGSLAASGPGCNTAAGSTTAVIAGPGAASARGGCCSRIAGGEA